MAIRERVVETFDVMDEHGRTYLVQKIEQTIQHDGRLHEPAFRFALEGGGAVSELRDGRFRIAGIPTTMMRAGSAARENADQSSASRG